MKKRKLSEKQSEFMKKHNPMFNPESRAKLSKSKTGKKLGAVHSEKFKEERRNRWLGSGNPNYGGISIERRQNLSKTKKRLYASGQIKPSPQKKGKDNPRYGIPRSNETKEKIRKRLTGKVRSESTKQKIRQARAKQKNFGQAGSFSEKCLHTILDELGIEYDIHVGHLPGSPDILIKPNIVIFSDGEYTHANPEKFSDDDVIYGTKKVSDIWAYDSDVNYYLESYGYEVLRFWDSEIQNKTEIVIEKIKHAIMRTKMGEIF